MNSPEFQRQFEEQNRRDFITAATIGTAICIPLNLSCLLMDDYMYPERFWIFFKARIISVMATALGWLWFRTKFGQQHPRYGVMWFLSPQIMILWMIYAADDPFGGVYYAGLNIVILGIGVLSPWAYGQNLAMSVFTLLGYLIISIHARHPVEPKYVLNNFTFLFLTAALVVCASIASSRQRFREFTLRYELDKSKRDLEQSNYNLEISNEKLGEQNTALEKANREIKEAEMQLVQSEKMSSLGRFSAGLMHDILNPLNYARTGLFVLRKKIRNLSAEPRAEADAVITDIEDGLKRVDNIVSDLRTFTHPGGEAAIEADLADLLNIALRFVSSELKDKNISLTLNVASGQKIWTGRNHFILVLVNLLENAIDALAEKKFPDGAGPTIEITSRVDGEHTLLFIRDNGSGIAPQNLPKIFDPFFTTKEIGKGTGLGLSICFGIIRGYGGTISATSEPGMFTEFTLELPATAAAAAKNTPDNAGTLQL